MRRMPGVFGWPVVPARDGKLLGAYVARSFAGQRVVVFYSPDSVGRAGLAGFRAASRGVKLTARPAASPGGAASVVAAARAAGVKVVVTFTSPLVTAAVKSAMAAKALRVPLVSAGSGLASSLPDGVITDGFLPSPGAPATRSWITLFRRIRAVYLARQPFSPAMIDGMSSAFEMAAAMFRAGPGLTREDLVAALSGLQPGPSVVPLAYTAADHSGAEGGYVGVIRGGFLVPLTGVMVTADMTSELVMAYRASQQPAPADGVPRH